MAKIFAKYSFTGISSPFIIVTVVEHSNPLAEVTRTVLTAPYEGSVTFTSLNPVMHRVSFYQSANGTTLGALITSLSIDATIYNEPTVEIITFQVGAGRGTPYFDPADGANSYTNPSLAGCTKNPLATGDKFVVYQEGLGVVDPSQIDDITNGFQFNNGQVFADGARYQVIKYVTVSFSPAEVVSQPYVDILDVSANFTFGTAHYNRFFRANWSGSVGVITFPAHASIPNFTRVKISTHGGNQNYVRLQFNGSETTKFFNSNRNAIFLAKGEEIELMWRSGACFVIDYRGKFTERGKVVMSYDNITGRPFLRAHVDTGVLNKSDYPGLYEYVESLPAGVAVSLTDWATVQTINGKSKQPNRSRWGIDPLTETFRVPHLANLGVRFLKLSGTADAERVNDVPGGYQIDKVEQHAHSKTTSRTKRGAGSDPDHAQRSDVGDQFGGTYTESSGNITNWPGGESETRMENFGQIPLIQL